MSRARSSYLPGRRLMRYVPSFFAIAPNWVPDTATDAPATGSPVAVTILPVTVPSVVCAASIPPDPTVKTNTIANRDREHVMPDLLAGGREENTARDRAEVS